MLGVVPSTVFASEARDGYDMLRYESDPGSAEAEQRLSIEIAVVETAEAVALDGSSVTELDAGRALLLHGGGADGGVVRYALCDAELAADVHTFDLDAGTIAFHTRPAVWGINSGFTVLAEGVVSGKTLSVDSYWDLGYSSADMGTGGLYGVMPSLFVRAEDDGDGRCALVVEANPMDNGQSFVARWLACDGSTTEVLTVLGSQFEPGAGTSAPMRR